MTNHFPADLTLNQRAAYSRGRTRARVTVDTATVEPVHHATIICGICHGDHYTMDHPSP